MGFEQTTPIQAQTIPLAMEGKDIIGQAQTGTGKTTAFGIPLLEQIDMELDQVQGIVIAPTRELAVQVGEELNKIGQFKKVRTLPIYGGQDIGRQIRALKRKPHVIVGTPGRIIDHIRRKTIKLHTIKTVVLDEADEMLNMGFVEDIETILSEVPDERQTLLFSATMPKPIERLAQKFMKDPELIKVKAKEMTVPNIEQEYIEVSEKKKFDTLSLLLDIHSPELAIVFGRTKRRVDELAEALTKRGYDAEGIHGDLNQRQRENVLRKFKGGNIEVLVATDVAARGLDVSGVTHVYNFDVPQDPESYVHRIGRTGRAGKKGLAITFVTPREMTHLKTIEQTTKKKMERKPMPKLEDAIEGKQRQAVEQLLEVIGKGEHHNYKATAEELLEDHDSIALVSAALRMVTKEPDTTPIKLTGEAPLRVKKQPNQKNKGDYRGKRRGDRDRNQGRGQRDRGRRGRK
ncbi:DEAD/DEAH box helicase [Desertibacillus haloalkaliphilus]|uniref:DEAD/DEAH box helicase n=1 Tax=Desertibacillus haloalkaliphilus TaxID=1328930 RepID=UPI001C27466B|nr:DEAD/DEAH box helicase [Desertibacillus haloalkaliphilus]MBU8906857.1 DEAD/DEAH box helicase [Desertibacillus haloalkaliphilus]